MYHAVRTHMSKRKTIKMILGKRQTESNAIYVEGK